MSRTTLAPLVLLTVAAVGSGSVALAATPAARTAAATRTATNTSILCLPKGGSGDRVAKRHPTSCTTLGPKDSFAGAVNLSKLKWKHWGAATTIATGVELGFHEPADDTAVTVTLSRPRANDCGGFTYTRLSSVAKSGGTTKQSLPAVCKG